jgi:eukaryotic-like serine/threonine-protein kinase
MPLEDSQLGRYHLIRLLGRGAMGEVYLAEDMGISRQVAIKVIRSDVNLEPGIDTASEATLLCQHEMRTIARLNHPHILPLFDYGETMVNGAPLPYMVMPFCQDGSLAAWLKQRSSSSFLSPLDVAHIVQQAAEALQYAHDQQIIHRDVKPSNFLIRYNQENSNRPYLLLADFGLATLSSASISKSLTIGGTPPYMAPEQWRGHPVPATDQYMLAVMAYELLTGRTPFRGSLEQLMYQHIQEQPEPPAVLNPQIPVALNLVILRALTKQPEARFPGVSGFARAFQQALQGDPQPQTNDLYATLDRRVVQSLPASSSPPIFPQEQQSVLSGSAATRTDWAGQSGQQRTATPESRSSRGLNINFAATRKGLTCGITLLLAVFVVVGSVAFFGMANRPAGVSTSSTTGRSAATTAATPPSPIVAQVTTMATTQGTATATAFQNIYKQATSGTPVLDDPLRDNSKGYNWDVGSAQGGVCQFTNGSYQVSMSQPNMFYRCTARATNFIDFAYQVQVTLVKGDQAGIIFRFDEITATFYTFYISSEGTYALNTDNKQGFISQLANGSSSAIKTGPNQSNLVAVLARGSQISIYVNGQYLVSVQDSTYKSGAIGVIAENDGHPTEALFSDAKVWRL